MAMMCCESIGCPHPSKLEEHGVGWDELTDWYAYYLWKNGASEETRERTDAEKKEFLDKFMSEMNGQDD